MQRFFAENHYDVEHPDELVYLVTGDDDIPAGFPTLTLSLPLT